MARIKLTDAAIKKLTPPAVGQVHYWDEQVTSLTLRLFSSGARSWYVRPRVLRGGEWKPAFILLGKYPDLSLADARDKAREMIVKAKAGEDPGAAKVAARRALEDASRNTFGSLADEFLEKYAAKKRPATQRQYRWALKGIQSEPKGAGIQAWQDRPITSIEKRDVLDLVEGMVAQGKPIQADRQLASLKRFFSWLEERDILKSSPTHRLKPTEKNEDEKKERKITPAELAEIYRAILADPGRKHGGLFRQLLAILLLTGQRREEVAGMRWGELRGLEGKEPVWEIPRTRTKNKRVHLVPLSPQVVALIKSVPRVAGSDFVFTTTGETSVSGFSRAKLRVDEAIGDARKKAGVTKPMEPWVVHHLRHALSTQMHEDLGILPHIVEAILNHVSGHKAGVAGTYNHALYLDDKRRALEAWANHVDRLVSGAAEASNVVSLARAGRGRKRSDG